MNPRSKEEQVDRIALLSNGGDNAAAAALPAGRLIVGTVDGVFVLDRRGPEWAVVARGLEGSAVSAVTRLPGGTLLAATHGLGVARSTDDGETWDWSSDGIPQFDLWAARAGNLRGRPVAVVGSMPAHLMISEDDGTSWRELPALREVASTPSWCFPPPPRLGHVKEIVIHADRLFVGIEIGALLCSDDGGASFTDLRIDPDPAECDVHRLAIDPTDPDRMIAAVGLVGLMRSEDGGTSWERDPVRAGMEYPDPFVMHPERPDLLFMAVGVGWPPHWYASGRAQGKIARSEDGGRSWQRLLGGLPDGQRALFSALSLQTHADGFDLFAADTDGQVYESRDGGRRWRVVADLAPVSKGEFHRALAKDRPRIAGVDDIVVNPAAAARLARVTD
jgi:photosystem II stability/assembly factor-like uncharacterized protein